MMLALDQAGAQHSQSPVGADMRDGDQVTMEPPKSRTLFHFAHFSKVNGGFLFSIHWLPHRTSTGT